MDFDKMPRINLPTELNLDKWNCFRFIYAQVRFGQHVIARVIRTGESKATDDSLRLQLEQEIAEPAMNVKVLAEGYLEFYETHHYKAGKKVEICTSGGFHRKKSGHESVAQILEARFPGIECLDHQPCGD